MSRKDYRDMLVTFQQMQSRGIAARRTAAQTVDDLLKFVTGSQDRITLCSDFILRVENVEERYKALKTRAADFMTCGRYSEALEDLTACRAQNAEPDIDVDLAMIRTLGKLQRHQEAAIMCRSALMVHTLAPQHLYMIGVTMEAAGLFDDAFKMVRDACVKFPHDQSLQILRGNFYKKGRAQVHKPTTQTTAAHKAAATAARPRVIDTPRHRQILIEAEKHYAHDRKAQTYALVLPYLSQYVSEDFYVYALACAPDARSRGEVCQAYLRHYSRDGWLELRALAAKMDDNPNLAATDFDGPSLGTYSAIVHHDPRLSSSGAVNATAREVIRKGWKP